MADDTKVPRKYWWVVPVAVPIGVALIAIVPTLVTRGCSPAPAPAKPEEAKASAGPGGVAITGGTNTINFDYSTRTTFVTNVSVIAREYEQQTGHPLSDDLRRQIEAAVAAATQNNHAESIRLLEQVAKAAPVPAVYHNLGVEYEQTKNAGEARRAFDLSKEKIAEMTAAPNAPPLPASALTPPAVSGPGIKTESSAVPAMTIDPVSAPYEAPDRIDIVAHGTSLHGRYEIKYQPKPGVTVVAEPGAYDVLMNAGEAVFLVASNVVVREGTLTRINPNALVGGIAIEPVRKPGFPAIKKLVFLDRASGERERLITQQTEKLGVTLPITPGNYQVIGTTVDGQQVQLAEDLAVKAGAITRLDPIGQVAAIVVHAPNIAGLDMKLVYALKAGTNQIAAQVEAWDVPMLVPAGMPYDIALKQAAGLTRIRTGITPGRGELVEIR